MKEIYNGQTVALGGPNMVTKELVVDESTGERAKFTYDKTTGAIAVQDEVDKDSINPVTGRAVAKAIEQGGGGGSSYSAGDGIAIESDVISAKVDGTTITVNESGELEAIGGGGGATYTAGDGISIAGNQINVAYNTQDFSVDNPMLVSYSIAGVNDARYLQLVDEGDTVQPYFNRDGGEISITASAAQAGCTIRFGVTTNPEYAFDILGFSTMPVVDSFGDPVLLAEGTNSFTDMHTDYEEAFETLFPDVEWYDVEGMCLVAVDGNGDIVGDPLTLPADIQFSTTTTKMQKKLLLNRPVPSFNTSSDNGKVLTVTGSGMAWTNAGGYEFTGPLAESNGTVSLAKTATLNEVRNTRTLYFGSSLDSGNGDVVYVNDIVQDTTGDTFKVIFNVLVPSALDSAASGKHIFPVLVDQEFIDGNTPEHMFVIPKELEIGYDITTGNPLLNDYFNLCTTEGDANYPVPLVGGSEMQYAKYLAFGVFSTTDPEENPGDQYIYGTDSTQATQTLTYEYGQSKLNVVRPVPYFSTSSDNGKVLSVTGSGLAWQTAPSAVQLLTVPDLSFGVAETLYGLINTALSSGSLPVLVTANSTNSNNKRYWSLTHIENSPDPTYGFNAYRFTAVEPVYNSGSSYDIYEQDIIVQRSADGTYGASSHRYQIASTVAQASFNPFTA